MLTIQGVAIRERLDNLAKSREMPLSVLQNEISFLDAEEQALVFLAARCKLIEKDSRLSPAGKDNDIAEESRKHIKHLASTEAEISKLERALKDIEANIVNSLARVKGGTPADPLQAMLLELKRQEVRGLLVLQEEKSLEAHEKRLKLHGQVLSDQQRETPRTIFDTYKAACRDFNSDRDRNRLLITALEKSPIPGYMRDTFMNKLWSVPYCFVLRTYFL